MTPYKIWIITLSAVAFYYSVKFVCSLFPQSKKIEEPEDLYEGDYHPEDDYKSSEKPFLSLAEVEREIKGTTRILGDDLKKRDLIIKRQKSIL